MSSIPKHHITDWLPTTAKEVKQRDWDEPDVILFSGDAYVDHPSFGTAVIGRILEAEGLKVAIVPQPNWRDDLRDFKKLGRPKMFFGITAGCMDSMVNHYTANKRKRSNDAYTPGGKAGFRPDYATITYSKILKELYPDVPVIIGGIEASLRRLTHYDYWSDQLMPGILADSKADLLFYGMGEKSLQEFTRLVKKGVDIHTLTTIPQTAFLTEKDTKYSSRKKWETITLFSHEECIQDKKKYAMNFRHIEEESNKMDSAKLVQAAGNKQIVVNPAWAPLTQKEIDSYFDLPFTRLPHPRYKAPIPAYEMIRHSINIHRGCFGGCSFCTISAHQGKFIVSRSEQSILKELDAVTEMPDFKGNISDIGGPSANMYKLHGKDLSICAKCKRPSCLDPNVCKNLNTNHQPLLDLYRKVSSHPKVKKAFIGSGIRYDLVFQDTGNKKINQINREYMREVIRHHVSGRLKVAPEHTSDTVLKIMRKPSFGLFHRLYRFFQQANKEEGMNQQLIPYFISSHPGSKPIDMADLAVKTKNLDFKLEQVQDFTPTPMTVSTVIYYSGYHPYTMEKVYTARTQKEKLEQRMFFFWYKQEYQKQIKSELIKMNRPDLAKALLGEKEGRARKTPSNKPDKIQVKDSFRKPKKRRR